MEKEPLPNYAWHNDAEGWYIKAKTNVGEYDLRDDNTIVFRHDKEHNHIDHIFRMTEIEENRMTGIYIWRHSIPGFFDAFADDLIAHGFEEEYNEVPEEEDINKWEEITGKNYRKVVIENLVRVAMSGIDHEWAYFSEEEGWGDGNK